MLNEQELVAYLENTLAPADRYRIEAELEHNPQRRRELVSQSKFDAALRVALGGDAVNRRVKQSVLAVLHGESEAALKEHVLADTALISRSRRRDEAPTSGTFSILHRLATFFRRPAWAIGLATACMAIVLGAWLVTRPATATLAFEIPTQVALAAGIVTPKSGDTIRAGDDTSATVTFADGTILHLEPGTEVRFEPVAHPPRNGGKQFKLIAGALTASVAKQPVGLPMLIQTPHALVTVVGTEFDLTVATNQTELEVTHGLVKMTGDNASRPVSVVAGESAVATPETGPRLQSLPRHPFFWPFSSASLWNTPIGSAAKYEPLPGRPFLADGPLAGAVRGRRPFLGRAADPLRNIWVNGERRADIRFANPDALPLGKTESVVLLQHSRRYAIEVLGLTLRADGDLEAEDIERTSLMGAGMDAITVPAKPYGLSQLGGLIRAGEYERGMPHALSARVNRERLGGRASFHQPSTVWPATGSAEAADNFVNVGTLLAIPPDVDIRQVVGDSGPAYELARAMQDYGVYVTGFSDAPFVLLAGEARLDQDAEDAMVNKLVPLLKVVANNHEQTPGGGGTPRREPAPELPDAFR